MCQDQPDGTQMCLADAAYTILRGRLPSGELHEVKIYADFANDPAAFQEITATLENYQHPAAVPYQPEAATLFISPLMGEPEGPVPAWPLEPALLQRANPEQPWATTLEGDALAAFIAGLPRNMGDFPFEYEGQRFNAFLVPWLPGVDYRADIQAEFPAQTPGPAAAGHFSDCPIPSEEESARTAGRLRLAYTAEEQLWVWDEGQEPVALADGADIDQVLLTPDGQTVVFVNQGEVGAGELWAIGASGEDLRPLAGAGLTGRISDISFSDDGQLLAFSHQVKEGSSELWSARLDGSDARQRASVEDLRAIFDDFPDPQGVIPYSVQWIPGTHRLTYDAFPTGDGIFIYVQDQAYQVDADSGQKSVLFPPGEGGALSYSPDGTQLAIITTKGLSLMDLDSGQRREVDVPYFAVGFGEFYFYPPVVWTPDSSRLLLALPESEEYSQDGPITIWSAPADGTQPSPLVNFSGFAPSFQFSPDLARVAYWSAPPQSNDRELHLANVDGSEDVLYVTAVIPEFHAWAPDSRHFVYSYGEGEAVQTALGDLCADPVELADFRAVPLWVDDGRFLLAREQEGGLELHLANFAGETTLLLTLENSDRYAYTVLPGD
jgi:Tol biopolymer transport system component